MKDKQKINCNVHTCKHCNCDEDCCALREIEIKNQSGQATDKRETICNNYELENEKMEDED